MKALLVRIGYGKKSFYIGTDWVIENALENYKKRWTEEIRKWGWKKDIEFKIQNYTNIDKNGTGEILAYTINDFKEIIKVE